MVKLASVFVVAAVLFPASAVAATAVLQRCDQPIADVDQMERTLTECRAYLAGEDEALAEKASAKPLTEVKVVMSTSPVTEEMGIAARVEPLYGHLRSYYAYLAYASGDISKCSPLTLIGDLGEAAKGGKCQLMVSDLNYTRARYGTVAQFYQACMASCAAAHHERHRADDERCCDAIAKNRDRPDPCAAVIPVCKYDAAACRAFYGSIAGDVDGCRNIPRPTNISAEEHRAEIAICEGDALFAKAFKQKSIAACAGSPRCRVLMGEGKAVAAEIASKHLNNPVGRWFLSEGWKTPIVVERKRVVANLPPVTAPRKIEFRGFVCARPLASPANGAAVTAALNGARVCLQDVETALARPTREVIAGIDERLEKLARHELRLNKHFTPQTAARGVPGSR